MGNVWAAILDFQEKHQALMTWFSSIVSGGVALFGECVPNGELVGVSGGYNFLSYFVSCFSQTAINVVAGHGMRCGSSG